MQALFARKERGKRDKKDFVRRRGETLFHLMEGVVLEKRTPLESLINTGKKGEKGKEGEEGHTSKYFEKMTPRTFSRKGENKKLERGGEGGNAQAFGKGEREEREGNFSWGLSRGEEEEGISHIT